MSKIGQSHIVWRKFRRNKASLLGISIVMGISILVIFAPWISPYDPHTIRISEKELPPSIEHWLGTDHMGRDVFSYILWGGRTSLSVGFGAVLIELVIALIIGGLAGYYGGFIDDILMRITDIILTIPAIILLIVAVSMFEVRSSMVIMVIMAVISWPWLARTIRSEFLSLKESLFVEAARSLGASDFRIIFKHILPNAISPLIVFATLDLAWFILYQATITFLGLGDPTVISWGTLINRGRPYLQTAWWITTFPGITIFITVLGLNLLGDGLRDAFDIKTRA